MWWTWQGACVCAQTLAGVQLHLDRAVREVKDFVLSQQLNPLRDGEQNALREFYVLLPPFYGVKQW